MAPTPVQTFELGEFLVPEEAIAERLGLSRAQIRAARGPEKGRWAFGPNRRVLWSQDGLALLQAEVSAPVAENVEPAEGLAVLVVWQSHVPNRKTLIALRKGVAPETAEAADHCVVYLGHNGDNRRFVPGMEVLARPYRGAAWWFEGNPESPEHGRRLPRAVGRW